MQMGVGGGGVKFSGKKRYESVRFNVISVMRGGWGSNFQEKKCYVTLEWPLKEKESLAQHCGTWMIKDKTN